MAQGQKWWCSTKTDFARLIVLMIPADFGWIWTWDKFHWKGYLHPIPRSPWTPRLDVVCELGISFNMDSSWMSWTLDTEIFSAILVESYFSQTLDWFHWNFISSSFCAYVNFQIPCCMRLLHQFEAEVVLDFDMDLKSNSRILNWIGSPPWCVHLLIISMVPNNN
jgi:hypothetical protein